MERRHLITVDEFKQLARPTSQHLDEDEVMAFIREVEQVYIIPAIGYGNYKAAISNSVWEWVFDDTFVAALAINGGEYQDKDEDGKTIVKYCDGLKATTAYFAYARMLRADGAIVSRAGFMRHNEEYASHIEDSKHYNDVMDVAERYISSVLSYLKLHSCDKKVKAAKGSRCKIKAIGQ